MKKNRVSPNIYFDCYLNTPAPSYYLPQVKALGKKFLCSWLTIVLCDAIRHQVFFRNRVQDILDRVTHGTQAPTHSASGGLAIKANPAAAAPIAAGCAPGSGATAATTATPRSAAPANALHGTGLGFGGGGGPGGLHGTRPSRADSMKLGHIPSWPSHCLKQSSQREVGMP